MTPVNLISATILELVERYRTAAVAQAKALDAGRHRVANRNYEMIVSIAHELRSRGLPGDTALQAMLGDPELPVRVWAAVHTLGTWPAAAERVLVEAAQGPPSPTRLDAEMILKEWRAGRFHAGQ